MSDTSETRIPKRWLPWAVAIGVLVVVVVVALSIFGTYQGNISKGNQLESQLSASYANGANSLSSCVVKTAQTTGAAEAEADAVGKVLTDVISGRKYTKPDGSTNQKALINALMVTEAYPDTTELQKTFQQAMAIINGCRDDYRNQQAVVQAGVSQFNSWRTGSWGVRTFGGSSFPNEHLYVTVGGQTLTGQAAFDKIGVPIVDTVTDETYKKGTFKVTNPFDTKG